MNPYFDLDDVPEALRDAARECADIRECYNKRIPFKVDELPEVGLWPFPVIEGQVVWLNDYNPLSGQLAGTQRGVAVKKDGRLFWVFERRKPARGVGRFVCD